MRNRSKGNKKPVEVVRTVQSDLPSRLTIRLGEWTEFSPSKFYKIGGQYEIKALRGAIIQLQKRVKPGSNRYRAKLICDAGDGWKAGDKIKIWRYDIK